MDKLCIPLNWVGLPGFSHSQHGLSNAVTTLADWVATGRKDTKKGIAHVMPLLRVPASRLRAATPLSGFLALAAAFLGRNHVRY